MQFNNKNWKLERYPKTSNNSLKPYSAADELLLQHGLYLGYENKNITLIHDSFGALATALEKYKPTSVITYHSQLKSIWLNLKINKLDSKKLQWVNVIKLQETQSELVLMKVPKSANLFELYLSKLHSTLNTNATVLCGFMTKYFTPRWLDIAAQYFDVIEQSKAHKKARIIVLKSPKKQVAQPTLFHTIKSDLGLDLKQFSGVFSADKIDPATRVLLENLPAIAENSTVLDLACGNGVIGKFVKRQNPEINLHLLDDNLLAVNSAKLNISKEEGAFYWSNSLSICKEQKFNLILCNPPFHFEYENNIEVSIKLFKEAFEYLEEGGEFRLVANTHLNYKTHLNNIFKRATQVVKSGKYEVISCIK